MEDTMNEVLVAELLEQRENIKNLIFVTDKARDRLEKYQSAVQEHDILSTRLDRARARLLTLLGDIDDSKSSDSTIVSEQSGEWLYVNARNDQQSVVESFWEELEDFGKFKDEKIYIDTGIRKLWLLPIIPGRDSTPLASQLSELLNSDSSDLESESEPVEISAPPLEIRPGS